ncbi:bcl-2-like protein 15 [Amia ocellicauda]|uniref:bcl-2-like protein 15 n=1 Tax=Amia ocellicauda TaxID=2972642 RepID=UPI0034638F77
MAPRDLEQQTLLIVHFLFEEPTESNRCLMRDEGMVADSTDDSDTFDPVLIAEKLRTLGDDYNEKVIKPHMDKFVKEARTAAVDKVTEAFCSTVDSMGQVWAAESGSIRQEKYLLKATVMLGLYASKNCPNLSRPIQAAVTQFLNTRLGSWISGQGGWEEVASD